MALHKKPLYIHISKEDTSIQALFNLFEEWNLKYLKKNDGGPIELKNATSYLIYPCKSWAPPNIRVYIFHTMCNLSYSQLGMSKVLKATMQVYGRKSPYPSQGKHVTLAIFLTFSLSTCGLPFLGRRYGTRGIFDWTWCGHASTLWGSCFFNQRIHKILPALLYLQL